MARLKNSRQEAFCQEYVKHFCGKDAAISAGYSKRTAKESAYRTLNLPHVKARIEELQQKASDRNEIDVDRIIREWTVLANSDVMQFVEIHSDSEGRQVVRLKDDLPRELRACIHSIESTSVGIRFRLHDKTKALENLGRIAGIYAEDNRQRGGDLSDVARRFLEGQYD